MAISKFLELTEQNSINRKLDEKPAHCITKGDKGCIQIVVDIFEPLPSWKQTFVVRHGCCPLLHRPSDSPTLELLSKKYSLD